MLGGLSARVGGTPSPAPHDPRARRDVDRAELRVDDRAVHVVQIRRTAGYQAQVQRGGTEASDSPGEARNSFGVRMGVASEVHGEEKVFRIVRMNVNRSAVELRAMPLRRVVRRT